MDDDLIPHIVAKVRSRTPARLLAGRSGGGYRTATQLELRAAHAAARDAVRSDFNLEEHLGSATVKRFSIFEVSSEATSKDEYLLRPDLGRRLSGEAKQQVLTKCVPRPDLQIVIGDGLSCTAVAKQVPTLLPLLIEGATTRSLSVGQIFAVRFCRVAILNDIGDLLAPKIAVLLIGERPGLATAESLSAYMAFRPKRGQTDADRNLISNIHQRGVPIVEAAARILALAAKMMRLQLSGVKVREELPAGIAGELSRSGNSG